MKININRKIESAATQNVLWSISEFYTFIEEIVSYDVEVSFWDGEENWATLSINDDGEGYIWKRYPLLIVEKSFIGNIEKILEHFDFIQVVEVSAITSKELAVNREVSIKYLDTDLSKLRWFN